MKMIDSERNNHDKCETFLNFFRDVMADEIRVSTHLYFLLYFLIAEAVSLLYTAQFKAI